MQLFRLRSSVLLSYRFGEEHLLLIHLALEARDDLVHQAIEGTLSGQHNSALLGLP